MKYLRGWANKHEWSLQKRKKENYKNEMDLNHCLKA
jgi:hypothetical protein